MTWFPASLVGAAIACLYCAGLWLAIGLASRRAQPLLWFGLGSLLRLAVVGSIFLALARSGPETALAALAGFAAARGSIAYRMRIPQAAISHG
ncbi:MAG TPA: ATP synthase subunit I [Pirellulales bacterium]|nr:ATP synthase subunit I [Pirellulales bacterium]